LGGNGLNSPSVEFSKRTTIERHPGKACPRTLEESYSAMDIAAFGVWQVVMVVVLILALLLALLRLVIFVFDFETLALVLKASLVLDE